MRRSFIFDQGASEFAEDAIVDTPEIVGVLDGVSTPYGPGMPPTMYDPLSSGEMAVRAIQEVFWSDSRDSKSLDDLLERAARRLRMLQVGRVPHQADTLAGAALALAMISKDTIEVVQAADCFAVLGLTNGELLVTPYQARGNAAADNRNVTMVFEETAQSLFGCAREDVPQENQQELRTEFWRRYLPVWMNQRKGDINNSTSPNGFALLNGQREFLDLYWSKTYEREAIRWMLFFTDGMVPPNILACGDEATIGRAISGTFHHHGGWPRVLAEARAGHERAAKTSYISQPEATGYAIQF